MELIKQEFDNPITRIFGASLRDEVIGMLICHVVNDESHIINFGIRTSWRRLGVGRLLLSEVLKRLSINNIRRVTLEVRPSNSAAIRLYRSFGFDEVGLRPKYYSDDNEDALIMGLKLVSESRKFGSLAI